jgi:TRAP-type transport system periplasmic protein
MSSSISRRQFTSGLLAAGGSLLLGRGVRAADFKLRQFHNQPADSPLHKRLVEMWAAVKQQTGGRVDVQTFAQNDHIPGGDPAAFQMIVHGGLDFFTLNGGLIGSIVPAMNVQSIPFAFRTHAQVYKAFDGDLGDHLCDEMIAKGIYGVRRGCFANGFHELTCSTKPIRNADDLRGVTIRTPDAEIYVECWKTLGAVPVVTNLDKAYAAMKSGAAQAQSDPLSIIEALKLYEVQKYVSMTNHMWTGFNLIANLKMWQSLPADAQKIIERNVAKYVPLQRADNDALNARLQGRLTQQGMIFGKADTASFRGRLGPFYAHWKQVIGEKTWSLLEAHVGKLG